MEKSTFTHADGCNCGCTGGSLAGATGYLSSPCGCGQGLAEAPTSEAPVADEDLISEAKKYINDKVPTNIKIAAGIGVIALFLLATRGN